MHSPPFITAERGEVDSFDLPVMNANRKHSIADGDTITTNIDASLYCQKADFLAHYRIQYRPGYRSGQSCM